MPDPVPIPAQTASTLGADREKARSTHALTAVALAIRRRANHAGGSAKDVLDAQAMMAEDPALHADIDTRIDSGATAERAVFEAFGRFRDILAGLGGYQAERASDLDDIWRRAVAELQGVAAPGVPESEHPFILVARELAPADTAVLDLDKVLAVVTAEGG
ncbi:MAG: phosphoenolpyruvate-utilizing N-terminal domain-containing protein, partial [Microbacteriaceae bacterium]